MTRKEWWIEQFENLSTEEKVALFNEYASEHRSDDMIYDFDDNFFEMFYEGKAVEAVRAWHFGGKRKDDGHLVDNSWSDEYIKFNGYANLETMSIFEANDHCNLFANEIYENDDYDNYIDIEDFYEYLEEEARTLYSDEIEEYSKFEEEIDYHDFDSLEDVELAYKSWLRSDHIS